MTANCCEDVCFSELVKCYETSVYKKAWGWTASTGQGGRFPYNPPGDWEYDPEYSDKQSPYMGSHGGCPGCVMTLVHLRKPLKSIPCKLGTPDPKVDVLEPTYAKIKWASIPILKCCNAMPDESLLYAVWFDGIEQAPTDMTWEDYDELTPGTTHTVEVQAILRVGWKCEPSEKGSVTFTMPAPTPTSMPTPTPMPDTVSVTADSPIPLWYGDESGTARIPCTRDNPVKWGMPFQILVADNEWCMIATPHVDTPGERIIPFSETITDPRCPAEKGTYSGTVTVNGGDGTIHVELESFIPVLTPTPYLPGTPTPTPIHICSWITDLGGWDAIIASDISNLVKGYLGVKDLGFSVSASYIMGAVAYYLGNPDSGDSFTGCSRS